MEFFHLCFVSTFVATDSQNKTSLLTKTKPGRPVYSEFAPVHSIRSFLTTHSPRFHQPPTGLTAWKYRLNSTHRLLLFFAGSGA